MASSIKVGPVPDRLYITKSRYEIRYYTQPDTLAQAIAWGCSDKDEVAIYQRVKSPSAAELAQVRNSVPTPAFVAGGRIMGQNDDGWRAYLKAVKDELTALLTRF